MGYATPTQVYVRHPGRTFTATSKPSTGEVADAIDQTAAELDGILRARGYSLPIATTATGTLKLLEGYNALGADVLVEQAALSGSGEGKRSAAWKAWEAAKKMLATGQVELDADRDSDQALPRHDTTVGTSIFTDCFDI